MSAGMLFTDGRLCLAGYKAHKGHITGIGGKRKKNETLLQCAIRETIEELFGIQPSDLLVNVAASQIVPFRIFSNVGYTHFLCTFADLKMLMLQLYLFSPYTPFYATPPMTLEDLLFKRVYTKSAEIQQLVLLPFEPNVRIAHHLRSDITLCGQPASTMPCTPHTGTSTPHLSSPP